MQPFINLDGILVLLSALMALGLAGYALGVHFTAVSHRLFAAGMLLISAETVLGGLALLWGSFADTQHWLLWRTAVSSLVPVTWLLFALALGEKEFGRKLSRWKWVVWPVFLLPLLGFLLLAGGKSGGDLYITETGDLLIPLGRAGHLFHLVFILGVVAIMVAVENTLRSVRGVKRWQVKFLALGVLGYFAVRIYTASHVLLLGHLNLTVDTTFSATALLLAGGLMTMTFVRSRVLPEDIYLSGELIRRSLVLLLVGGYLVSVGLLAKFLSNLERPVPYRLVNFAVFAALVFMAAVLFSDRLRVTFKESVARHFKRPRYNYRDIWVTFTGRTSSAENIRDLAARTANLLSEMFEVLSVNVWLAGDGGDFSLAGTTVGGNGPAGPEVSPRELRTLGPLLSARRKPFAWRDLSKAERDALGPVDDPYLKKADGGYCAPLRIGDDLLGFISLGDRVRKETMDSEELELLATIGDQVAVSIRNLELAHRLRQARETEALRKFSAFFVHDLKNVASRLSLMLQNFPDHYDNPDFRTDALALVAQSVDKMNVLTRRMAELREAPRIQCEPGRIEPVVREGLERIGPPAGVRIGQEHEALPEFAFDPEQIQKVVTNLVLNAVESVGTSGEIWVRTYHQDGWVVLEVADDGQGMDEEFMTNSLFQPFKTTKPNGLGIGLFQCRTIIEAHGGRVVVDSRPGQGASFQVFLPAGQGEGGPVNPAPPLEER